MPKLRKRTRKANALAALLRQHKLEAGLSSEEIGKRVGCTADNVRRQIGKPPERWTVGALKRYCDAIGIPYSEAFDAAAK